MKKIFAIISIFFFFAGSSSPVLAETTSSISDTGKSMMPKQKVINVMKDLKVTGTESRTDNLKQRALNEVNRRITSLTDVSSRISEIKKLSDTQKSALSSNVQAQIDALNALIAKIQADTDIDTLRTDVKSITSLYRIYMIYLPTTRIVIAGDSILNIADKLSEIANKLQTRIDEAKTGGSDTTEAETLLADMQAKIADAKTQANSAIQTASSVQPTGFPGNTSQLQTARKALQAARKDLNEARQDAFKIFVKLKKKALSITPPVSGEPTQGTTETPTAIPSATPSE